MLDMNWGEKFIKEYDLYPKAAGWLRAGEFASPQEAWAEGQDGKQMLWVLYRLGAITPKEAAKISSRIIREIGGVWHLLSKPSQAAVITMEKWIAGEARLADVKASLLLAKAEEATASLLLAKARAWGAGSSSEAKAKAMSAMWAAITVARVVGAVLTVESTAVVAAGLSAAVSAMWAASTGVAWEETEEETLKEIAAIVRQEFPVCPFPVK